MSIGSMNCRIKIENKATSETDTGFKTDWVTVCEVWAEKETLNTREFIQAQAVSAENIVKFKIRARKGLDTTMRVMDKDDLKYNITGILSPKGSKSELILMCVVNVDGQ